MKNENENNQPAFDINSWKTIPAISGKIATESDAKNGLAVFCLKNVGDEHKVAEIELPKLAYLTKEEDNSKELVVIIQAESIEKGIVQNLVSDLTNKYGKDNPFDDEDLFNDIYELTGSSDIKLFIE